MTAGGKGIKEKMREKGVHEGEGNEEKGHLAFEHEFDHYRFSFVSDGILKTKCQLPSPTPAP